MTTATVWCKPEDYGVLRFAGTDAASFLQGQLTNDVAAVTDARSQYTGYCTPKGRLLAVMLLWRHADDFDVLLPRELCEPMRKRLAMYILRAKVTAHDISAERALFGVGGERAADAVCATAGGAPGADYEVTTGDAAIVIRLPRERFLIVADASHAQRIESTLSRHATPAPAAWWIQQDIAAGIPTVVAATQEAFVPQMVNFDLIAAVSFSKGCYPGQEIVARTRYLGKTKQRMLRASVQSDTCPAPGDKLYSATYGEQACGSIVSAAPSDDTHHDVLAVVHVSDVGQACIHLHAPGGPVLLFGDLPYPVA